MADEPPSHATIVEALAHRAAGTPDLPAYAMDGETLTYGALLADARALAAALAASGLERGGRLGIVLPTGLDFISALYAATILGAAPVAVNPSLPAAAVMARLDLCRADAVVATRAIQGGLERPAPAPRVMSIEDLRAARAPTTRLREPDPGDTALLQLTSGTSGEQRAAVILHRNLAATMRSSHERLALRARDVFVNWIPLYHSLGLVRLVFGALFSGCPVHLVLPSTASLTTWLATIARTGATVTGGPDFAFRAAATVVDPAGVDLRSLRVAMCSGEPIRAETIERFERRFGVPGVIRPGYGLAEAGGVSMLAPGEALRVDASGNVSCGRPMAGLEVALERPGGHAGGVPPRDGEIRVRGHQVFAGYFDDAAATEGALRDGWLCTGDVGALDADGHLHVVGRLRSLIKRGGALIAPREVEAAAEGEPGVTLAAAIGVPRGSHRGTEDIFVVVEVAPGGAHGPALSRAIADRVVAAIGVQPGEVVIVAPGAIPRTPNGKIRHEELRRLIVSGDLERSGAVMFGRTSA